jgi:hypothetical protein
VLFKKAITADLSLFTRHLNMVILVTSKAL